MRVRLLSVKSRVRSVLPGTGLVFSDGRSSGRGVEHDVHKPKFFKARRDTLWRSSHDVPDLRLVRSNLQRTIEFFLEFHKGYAAIREQSPQGDESGRKPGFATKCYGGRLLSTSPGVSSRLAGSKSVETTPPGISSRNILKFSKWKHQLPRQTGRLYTTPSPRSPSNR